MRRFITAFSLFILSASVFTACTTLPVDEPVSAAEIMRNDYSIGLSLIEQFEKGLKFRNDPALAAQIKEQVEFLCAGIEGFRDASVTVKIFEPKNGSVKNYALPGLRIYLSTQFLKSIEHENQLAAGLALEIANIIERHLIQHVLKDQGQVEKAILSANSFNFTEEEIGLSIDRAIEILHQKRYDPRGLLSVFETALKRSDRNVCSPDECLRLKEHTHQTLVRFPPLRNPIVSSEDFITIQKRIKKL